MNASTTTSWDTVMRQVREAIEVNRAAQYQAGRYVTGWGEEAPERDKLDRLETEADEATRAMWVALYDLAGETAQLRSELAQVRGAIQHEASRELAETDDDDELACEGHESLAGEHMGETVYCDGTCKR